MRSSGSKYKSNHRKQQRQSPNYIFIFLGHLLCSKMLLFFAIMGMFLRLRNHNMFPKVNELPDGFRGSNSSNQWLQFIASLIYQELIGPVLFQLLVMSCLLLGWKNPNRFKESFEKSKRKLQEMFSKLAKQFRLICSMNTKFIEFKNSIFLKFNEKLNNVEDFILNCHISLIV